MRFLIIVLLGISFFANSQVPSPGRAQEKAIMLENGVIHNGKGQVFESGTILFEGGKISYVGASTSAPSAPAGAEKIDLAGKHVFPGFIALDNTLGLTEIGAVRASRDHSETGDLNPSVRSLIAYNTDSDVIPTIRSNGVLLAQPSPSSGSVCGSSSIVQLDAWNWEDAVVKADDGVFVNFPDLYSYPWWMDDKAKEQAKKRRMQNFAELKDFFDEAKAYSESNPGPNTNLKFEAMKGVFSGKQILYLRANGAKTMVSAIQFAEEYDVKKPVLVGAKEAHVIIPFLKEKKIPLVLRKMHSNPSRQEDDIDMVFKQPGILAKEGLQFCISYDRGHTGHRNLPFVTGSAVAYGLDYEKAISAISYEAARIVGIDSDYGSLEAGKSATLFVSEGDPLDILGNQLTHAFIDGRKVDLRSKQSELAEKFSEKYGLE